MKIVIDIPEEEYKNYLKMKPAYPKGVFCYIKAIQNGTILPKGHGRLIDADEAKENMMYAMCGTGYQTRAMNVLNEYSTPTIIEAESEEEE